MHRCTSPSFDVMVDGEVKKSGHLLANGTMEPPISPPEHIPDPEHTKPEDWDDRKQ